MSIPLYPRCICLTGFMGSGKSTVGAELATQTGRDFIDLDLEIARSQGRSIPEIFRAEGETVFREIEAITLHQVLKSITKPVVLALGGGTYLQSANRDLLLRHGARTVYLDADFDLLLARCCTEQGTRPLMQDPERFRRLFEERQPGYRQAEIVIRIGNRTPHEIAAEIAARLQHGSARPAVPE